MEPFRQKRLFYGIVNYTNYTIIRINYTLLYIYIFPNFKNFIVICTWHNTILFCCLLNKKGVKGEQTISCNDNRMERIYNKLQNNTNI